MANRYDTLRRHWNLGIAICLDYGISKFRNIVDEVELQVNITDNAKQKEYAIMNSILSNDALSLITDLDEYCTYITAICNDDVMRNDLDMFK